MFPCIVEQYEWKVVLKSKCTQTTKIKIRSTKWCKDWGADIDDRLWITQVSLLDVLSLCKAATIPNCFGWTHQSGGWMANGGFEHRCHYSCRDNTRPHRCVCVCIKPEAQTFTKAHCVLNNNTYSFCSWQANVIITKWNNAGVNEASSKLKILCMCVCGCVHLLCVSASSESVVADSACSGADCFCSTSTNPLSSGKASVKPSIAVI